MYNINHVYEPLTIEETIKIAYQVPHFCYIAGGTDVLIKLRYGQWSNLSLISLNKVNELKTIVKKNDGTLNIGAAISFTAIENHPLIKKYIPILAEAVGMVGGPQIRNMGTIGGNVCNGATSADSASTLFALDAQLELVSTNGKRIMSIKDFYIGPGKVKLDKGELLTAILISKKTYDKLGGCYMKYAMRAAMDIATTGCAAACKIEGNKIIEARLAFGVAAPTPIRCPKAEQVLAGKEFSEQLLDIFSREAINEVKPRNSWRASKEFRLQLIKELSKRAMRQGFIRAGGKL